MNHRENALRLRVAKLEQQNAALTMTFNMLLKDLEMTESVGCAFAWDLATQCDYVDENVPGAGSWLPREMLREWNEAMRHLEEDERKAALKRELALEERRMK